MVSVGLLALDSTKLAADASGQANRSYEQVAREIVAEAGVIDAREDELYGEARGDELPAELRERRSRRERLRVAKRELERERAESGSAVPRERRARLVEAKRRLDEEHAVKLEAAREHEVWRRQRAGELAGEGKKMPGRPPKPSAPPVSPSGRANTTDPDSRPVKTHRGFIQGYNAQAVATAEQIIVAAEIPAGCSDGDQLVAMVGAARQELERAGLAERPEVVLADAGYWNRSEIERLEAQGIEPLVPPDGHRRGNQLKRRAGPYAKMRAALASERGARLYRRRQQIIEPVFAQTKVTRRADRFQ